MALKNNINTYADMTAYNADGTKEYPNISYIIATDEVVWTESAPIVPKAIYNVSSTSSATRLLYATTGITKQIIDGVEQSSVVTEYIFSTTGEHVVEYEYANNQINEAAFLSCDSLISITIPDSITSIGGGAFFSCRNLTSITIPDSVTSIGDSAFLECSMLASVTVEATTPPTLGMGVFTNNASGRKIYVPAASVSTYQSASRWSDYANDIVAIQNS